MQKATLAKELLLSSGYMTINKKVIKKLGIETAVLLSCFAEAENMMADNEGWFFQTVEKVEEVTTLSRYRQDLAIEELKDKGILTQQNKGIPMKRYFKLNYENLAGLLESDLQPSLQEIYNQDCEDFTNLHESDLQPSSPLADNQAGKTVATSKESNYKDSNNKESNINNKDTNPQKKEPEIKYAEFVSMTNANYLALVARLGEDGAKWCIDKLDNYKGSSGKKYKSDYRAILSWVVREYEQGQQQQGGRNGGYIKPDNGKNAGGCANANKPRFGNVAGETTG